MSTMPRECVPPVAAQLSQLSESRPDFVLWLLSDGAGVQEYQIRLHHLIRLAIAVRCQNRQDDLRERLAGGGGTDPSPPSR